MTSALKPYPAYRPSGVEWLGEAPEHWEVLPNRALFEEVDERRHPEEPLLSVTITQGVIRQERLLAESSKKDSSKQDKSEYKLVRPGDFAYNKMRAWQGAIGVSAEKGIVSPAYVVERPRSRIVSNYMHHLLRIPAFAKEAERWSYGIASDMWCLRPEHFKMIYACLPSLPEQTAIACYLDRADQRTRRYIRAKEKLIELLEEEQQAIIHQAVSGQIDLSTGQPYRAYKPSGVEWLGTVPEQWAVHRLGRLATSFRTGPFGSTLHQSDYVDGGTPLINPVHMRQGQIAEDPRCSVSSAVEQRLSNYRLEKHDLLFARRGELGRCALVRNRETGWLCGTGSIRVRIAYAGIEPEYLISALQVGWVGEYLSLASVGTTMKNLNTAILKGVPVLVPPLGVQRQLLNQITLRSRKIGLAISSVHQQISLLHEYRTRLISDVVTGKLDVRKAESRLPKEVEELVQSATARDASIKADAETASEHESIA